MFTPIRSALATALVATGFVTPTWSDEPATPSVNQFSPQGYVKQVRQATAHFTVPMVALGDPRLADPFSVECSQSGHGRWADGTNWVYDFDADLPAGVSCRFTLKLGVKSLTGSPLSDTAFEFNTGGPAITDSLPRDGWFDVDEEQVFILKLDAPATDASVNEHAHCVVRGLAEQIPVELIRGALRNQILAQRQALDFDFLRLLWKDGEQSDIRVRNRTLERDDDRLVLLRCERRLPAATRVELVWGAGIQTASGLSSHEDQTLAFRVRAAFTAQVECTRSNARSGCIPVQPIDINFSSPVPRAQALAVRLKTDKRTLAPTVIGDDKGATVTGVRFSPPFPEHSSASVRMPKRLADDSGRPLENAARFPIDVRIDAAPPLVKFSGTFGILEADQGGVLPVSLRNLDAQPDASHAAIPGSVLRLEADPAAISDWLQRVEKSTEASGQWAAATPSTLRTRLEDRDPEADDAAEDPDVDHPRPQRQWQEETGTRSVFEKTDLVQPLQLPMPAGAAPMQLVGIPLGKPGFYVVELRSDVLGRSLLGRDETRYVATSALVTDLAVHFQWGREASGVWVTRLSDGTPVADATVVITDYCSHAPLRQGHTGPDGVLSIDASLGEPHGNGACGHWAPDPLLVVASKDADFSFTQSGWDQGIMPHEFALPVGNERETQIVHTVLDRMLFRAGETVSMKHFWRQHVLQGLRVPQVANQSHTVTVNHRGNGQSYTLNADFRDGVAHNAWTIPPQAKLGDYDIVIDGHLSGQFRVEQFRLPSMHGSVTGPAQPLVQPAQADLDVHVAYQSGGGAGGLAVKLRTLVEPRPQSYPDYPDYQFGGAPVKEGLQVSGNGPADLDFDGTPTVDTTRTRLTPVTLDDTGSARVSIDELPSLSTPAVLTAELEYADANGEILTASGHVSLLPSSLALGIRREGWVGTSKQLRFRVLALDLQGKPAAQQRVEVSLYQVTEYSYRKRMIGGFYSYETTRNTHRLPVHCEGLTDVQGVLACELRPEVSGQVLVRAETRDAQGKLAGATTSMWVVGEDSWWFGGTTADRMDVLPEKKEYQAGEVARFQVRMPFRDATALVTVEREGVLRSFVTQLSGQTPIVEVPIEANDSPNVFVSVLAVRGRVAHAEHTLARGSDEITALVDLTKPAYRLGITQIKVGWQPHRLEVRVTPAQSLYQVRAPVQTRIHVSAPDGQALPAGTEVAVAAVDEALLDLAANPSWQLLDAMMGVRPLEVWTSTAQMQVVGKRHYGRKAVPHGGGGGREPDRARESFDSLLLWQAQLPVDANGDVTLTIPLNDSLSSFRIVAIAHAGAELFGTGEASVRTTQDVILLSGLPPVVREGDQFAATFTVRNTTDHALQIQAQATLVQTGMTLPAQQLEVPAGRAREWAWTLTAPVNATALTWDVSASASTGTGRDHLRVSQQVIPAFPIRTYQATLAQLSAPLTIPAQIPTGAIVGRGGLEISLQPKLASLDGVREFMGLYPYRCLEQQISRAVALRDRDLWDSAMRVLPAYLDSDGLLKYFPTDWLQGDDTLTAYVLAIADEAGWPLNDVDREQMTHGLTRFVHGRLVRGSALPTADLSIRKLDAIAALSRYNAADAGMLDSITLEPNLWPTSTVLDWIDILQRVPGIADSDQQQAAAYDILHARLNFQGTTMGFSSEHSDALWWLMISTDSNANRMLLAALKRPEWHDDVARLVRGALGRQQFGHWNTTVANAWGVLAIEKFSAAFEATPVAGATSVKYDGTTRYVTWAQTPQPAPISLPWASALADLKLTHNGAGAPWAMVRATAALPLKEPLSTGYKIARTVTPVTQVQPGVWTRGDVVRVHLELEAQSDMSWVVVDDPIPAGASVLGSGLGGQSQLLARDEQRAGWAWLAFEERRFDGFRVFYRFVPKGHWSVDYTVRLNNPGTFLLPATRVEAMYAPEMLGELPNASVVVRAAP